MNLRSFIILEYFILNGIIFTMVIFIYFRKMEAVLFIVAWIVINVAYKIKTCLLQCVAWRSFH